MGKKSGMTHNELLELFRQTPSIVLTRALSEHWALDPAPGAAHGKRDANKQQRLNLLRWVAKVRQEYAQDISPSAANTDLSPGRPRLRKWQIWQAPDGKQNLHWAAGPYEHRRGLAKLVREFESLNWITATRKAFGKRVSVDPGIRRLVTLLNGLPGVMTVGCCQGHDEDEPKPYVSLIFDDEAALRRLIALAQFLSDENSPITMELSIVWAQTIMDCQEDQPPGALSVCMELMFRSSDELPPVEALDALAVLLRERAERAGLLRPARRKQAAPKAKRKTPTR